MLNGERFQAGVDGGEIGYMLVPGTSEVLPHWASRVALRIGGRRAAFAVAIAVE